MYLDRCQKLTDEGITKLAEALTNQKRLEILQFDFSLIDRVSDDSLSVLSEAILNCPNITKISLVFDG